MKWHNPIRTVCGSVIISSLIGGMIYAQDESSDIDDATYELSPFVVETQDDDGYLASTTLAGSRIRSNVKDLGTSLAIITEDFMDDMGGTDGESILGLVANVEVGGVLGNFANVDESNDNSTEGARLNPQSSQRIRGLSSAKTTRDYFDTLLPFDSYNTSRVSVNRGPNSILFGLGSPGGVINNSTNIALLNVDSGRISLRFDARGGHRETININRSIIEDRLAIRVAALNEHVKYQQEPAFEKDTRTFLAIDSVLLKNEKSRFLGKTKFRASYEDVYIDRNPPDVVPPTNSYQSYFEGFGSTEDLFAALSVPGTDLTDIGNNALTQDQVIAAVNAGLATVPDGMTLDEYAAIEGNFIPGTLVNRFAQSSDPASGRLNVPSTTRYWIFPILNYNTTTTQTPGFDDPELAGVAGIMGRWRPNYTQDHAWSAPATAGSGFITKSIMDRDVFDYHNNLFQGNTNYVRSDYELEQFYLTQEFFDGIDGIDGGLELAYDRQRYQRERFLPFSSGNAKTVYIDLSTHQANGDSNGVPGLRDGIPDSFENENVGRPLAYWNDQNTYWETRDAETLRATAFMQVNFEDISDDRWAKWLGQHNITGLFERRTNNAWNIQKRLAWWADDSKNPGSSDISNGLADNFRRILKSQVYLGDSAVGLSGQDQLRLSPINISFPEVGDVYKIWYFDNNAGIDQGQVADWRVIQPTSGGNRTKQVLKSQAISWQGHFLKNHLIASYAVRKDEQDSWQRLQHTTTYGDPSDPDILPQYIDLPGDNETDGFFNEALLQLEDEPASHDEGTTETWSVIGVLPEKWIPVDFISDFRVHYYEAESFQPAGISVNILNEALASPFGKTKEYGATVSLLNNRLSIRLNVFETSNSNDRTNLNGAVNQVVGTNSFDMWLTRIAEAENDSSIMLFPDAIDSVMTPDTLPNNQQRLSGTDADLAGFNSWDDYYAAVINAIPDELQDVYNFRMEFDESGRRFVESNTVSGVTSTQDYVSEGFELDINGQLTNNWSISFNLGKQETVVSNVGPVAIPLINQIAENLQQTLPNSPGGWSLWDLRDSPYQLETVTIGSRFTDGGLRNATIAAGKEGQVSTEQRKWRANVTLRYDFLDGAFEGLRVGGTLRFQDEIAAGYPNMVIEQEDAEDLVLPDVANPWMGPSQWNGDFFIRYGRPLTEKIDWSIQFNARNLYRSEGNNDIPVRYNADGQVARIRIPVEQQFFLTNTFSF